MIDSILVVSSALMGLLLTNCTILINSHACNSKWFSTEKVEVRYIAWLAITFLVMLNGNEWIPGKILFPILIIAAITTSIYSIKKISKPARNTLVKDGISLFCVQLATIVFVIYGFEFNKYWLLESHNHDSLFYYYGANWANESKLFVGSEAVRAKWGFDTWIGFDRTLYRGGTYTLAAWIQYFNPRITGNGLYLIAAYASTLAWFAVRLFANINTTRFFLPIFTALAIIVSFATGIIGALINSNLATVMGGSSLVIVVAIALRSEISNNLRYALMASWCAICAHFYGESIFYAGLFVSFIFVIELITGFKDIKPLKRIRLAIFQALIIIALGNIPVIQTVASIFFFSGIAKGGDWFSWYLHHSQMNWIGSFVSGLLMGQGISTWSVIISSILTIVSGAILILNRQTRIGIIALIGTSIIAVAYIKITLYQYGEHKILHLLGPSWTLIIAVAAINLINSTPRHEIKFSFINPRAISLAMTTCLAFICVSFASNSVRLLNNMRPTHSLDFGLDSLASYIRQGNTILIDDSDWQGVEKFFKSHYLAFKINQAGAHPVMAELSDNNLRGGYHRDSLNNSFKNINNVDWLIKGKRYGHETNTVFSYNNPVWENSDYALYRIQNQAVVAPGNGWYDCEQGHCWTTTPFQIESFVPANSGRHDLVLHFSVFYPKPRGSIKVNVSDGRAFVFNANSQIMRVSLPEGWSRLEFSSNFPTESPKTLGISEDSRSLFISINRIDLISPH